MLQIKNNPLSGNNTSEYAEIENTCKGREKLPVSVDRGMHGMERESGEYRDISPYNPAR